MANKIMEVTKLLGLEPFEEFRISGSHSDFRFTDSQFQCGNEGEWVEANRLLLAALIYGAEITRQPYRPKYDKTYWTLTCKDFTPNPCRWSDCAIDYCRLKAGIVFRTEKEAKENREEKMRELTSI